MLHIHWAACSRDFTSMLKLRLWMRRSWLVTCLSSGLFPYSFVTSCVLPHASSVLCGFTFLISHIFHSLALLVSQQSTDYIMVRSPPQSAHSHLRRLHHRPRRHPHQRHQILAQPPPQKASHWSSKRRRIHHLWLRRLQLPKIQLGSTKAAQASRTTRSTGSLCQRRGK